MCQSKRQWLNIYLFGFLVALVGIANHYYFEVQSAADAFVAESPSVGELEPTAEVEKSEAPAPVRYFATKAVAMQSSDGNVAEAVVVPAPVRLPAAVRVDNPAVDAGGGVKVYRNMLYAHSSRAGGAFKKLTLDDYFVATVDGVTATYRVVGRKVYTKEYLNSDSQLRLGIYNYADGLTLMTCGNGSNDDSNYRLVLWAVRA